MSKAFVDTSVLTDALLKVGPTGDVARNGVAGYAETQLPEYALKEFRAGPFSYVIWLYNKFAVEKHFSNVLRAIHGVQRSPQQNRAATAIETLSSLAASIKPEQIEDYKQRYGAELDLDVVTCTEYRIALKMIIYRAWRRRRRLTTKVVKPVACNLDSRLQEKRGCIELTPLACNKQTDCSLRKELITRINDLEALRDVAQKSSSREHQRRYQALRALCRTPNRDLSPENCRALGDAIFAFCCPADAVILTTNLKDHVPLAAALGKSAVRP